MKQLHRRKIILSHLTFYHPMHDTTEVARHHQTVMLRGSIEEHHRLPQPQQSSRRPSVVLSAIPDPTQRGAVPTGLRELTATRPPLCYQLALPSAEEERDVMLTMPLDFVPPAGVSVILAISRLLYCTLPFFPTPISRRGIAALASFPCSYLHTLSTSDGDGNSCYGKEMLYIHGFPSFSFL